MTVDDAATQQEELYRAAALSKRRPAGPPPCGFCHNCGEQLPPTLRFCGGHCREDWEYRESRS